MENVKKILTNLLLVFVLVSIGVAFGKHSVKPGQRANFLPNASGHQVVVYYLHSTFRCETCNTIESMTRELLENSYGDELAAGKILWIEADFQKNEALAERFEVAASCVVVVEMKDGIIADFARLDDVWTWMSEPRAFDLYIGETIDAYLERIEDPS